MTPTVRIYEALSRLLLPDGFSDAFAEELRIVYRELDDEARARGGAGAAWRGLAAELPGLVRIAVNERRTRRTLRAPRATVRLEENVFDSLGQDVRFAVRSLRRAPIFTTVAILTLALGIGANSAIFSVVNAVMLSPLKLQDPDRLVALGERTQSSTPGTLGQTSPGSFFDWKSSSRTLEIAGYGTVNRVLTGMGEPAQLTGTTSIGGLMQVLGVAPMFGRQLTIADEDPGAAPVVVLAYQTWQRLFDGDRGALGKALILNGVPRTIVGVMPPGFSFPGSPNDFWAPSNLDAAFRVNRDQYAIAVVGRLRPAVTIDQARRDMASISDRLAREWPKYNEGSRIAVEPLRDTIVGSVQGQLLVLMGAVTFVLLITCANIGNLLLARAAARQREIAVRHALGAGTRRIVRQLLTESVLLALASGVAGLGVGELFIKLLVAAPVTASLPRAEEIALDGRVVAFTLLVSVAVGLLFGCLPAWQMSRARFLDALRQGTRGSAGAQWTRSALVVSELALAMVLLVGAGLLLRSFDLMRRVEPGVSTDHVLTFSVARRRPDPTFFPSTLDRIKALPGVRQAGLTSTLPISGRGIGAWFNRIDRPLPDNVRPTGEAYRVVTPTYFGAVGIRLLSGRLLESSDGPSSPAIVVNEALARKYYPNENPIGKPVYLGAPDNRLFDSAPIVGVVANTRDLGLGSDPVPSAYIPLALMPRWPFFSYVVRTAGNPLTVAAAARRIIREADPSIPVQSVQTLDDVLAASTAPARWSTTLLGIFAGIALVTALLGVFGVLSYLVTQRTREVGIRIALGASSANVRRMIVARGLSLVAAGLAIGILGAVGLTRFMSSLLYGITPTDTLTFAGVTAVLVATATLASYLPARRATRVDPLIALRAE